MLAVLCGYLSEADLHDKESEADGDSDLLGQFSFEDSAFSNYESPFQTSSEVLKGSFIDAASKVRRRSARMRAQNSGVHDTDTLSACQNSSSFTHVQRNSCDFADSVVPRTRSFSIHSSSLPCMTNPPPPFHVRVTPEFRRSCR